MTTPDENMPEGEGLSAAEMQALKEDFDGQLDTYMEEWKSSLEEKMKEEDGDEPQQS